MFLGTHAVSLLDNPEMCACSPQGNPFHNRKNKASRAPVHASKLDVCALVWSKVLLSEASWDLSLYDPLAGIALLHTHNLQDCNKIYCYIFLRQWIKLYLLPKTFFYFCLYFMLHFSSWLSWTHSSWSTSSSSRPLTLSAGAVSCSLESLQHQLYGMPNLRHIYYQWRWYTWYTYSAIIVRCHLFHRFGCCFQICLAFKSV